jgi:hypothetical protein
MGWHCVAFAILMRTRSVALMLLIWDRCSGHKKAVSLLQEVAGHRIQIAYLPAYAPDLNGVDHTWEHTTYGKMANCILHDVDDPAQAVAHSLPAKHERQDLLKAFSSMCTWRCEASHLWVQRSIR